MKRIWRINGARWIPAVQTFWSVSRNVDVQVLRVLHRLEIPASGTPRSWGRNIALSFSPAYTDRSAFPANSKEQAVARGRRGSAQIFRPHTRTGASSLPTARKHPWLRVRNGSAQLFRPPTRSRTFSLPLARNNSRLWTARKTLATTFLHTDQTVCTADIGRAPFTRYIRFIKRHKWFIFSLFMLFNVVITLVLKKNQFN